MRETETLRSFVVPKHLAADVDGDGDERSVTERRLLGGCPVAHRRGVVRRPGRRAYYWLPYAGDFWAGLTEDGYVRALVASSAALRRCWGVFGRFDEPKTCELKGTG
jgi:hypothetical protein